MPQQALYLKWRPLTFEDVVGQEHVTRTLRNSIKSGRIRHAYLFSGPRGTGKTTMARLLAKAVNCQHEDPAKRPCNQCAVCEGINSGRFLDLIEIDAASHTSVDDVRDLRDKVAFAPNEGRYKVYIIDEVHRFSGNAFDALLKTLEEPPEHVLFILATTEIDKVPSTIKSRCLQFEFRRLSLMEVVQRMKQITDEEGIQIEQAALEMIAREGGGSARDSISLLDQVITDPDETITLELTQRILGTASQGAVRDLAEAICRGDVSRGVYIINTAIDQGSDPRQFGQQILVVLRNILLTQTASSDLVDAGDDERAFCESLASMITRSDLLRSIRLFNEATSHFSAGWQPQLPLELALIESIQEKNNQRSRYDESADEANAQPQTDDDVEEYVPAVASDPGAPPAIDPAIVQDKWVELQRSAFRYNQNVPALLEQVHVRGVEGNVLILGVQSEMFLDKLSDSNRSRIIERSLYDVHQVKLVIKPILVKGNAPVLEKTAPTPTDTEPIDPIVELGLELGGKLKSDDESES